MHGNSQAAESVKNGSEGNGQRSVLVVDDNPIDRQLACTLLSKNLDYRIRTAADGAEALRLIEAEPPALVLTDLRMPRMDGLELVRKLNATHPHVPVILITAHGSEDTAVEALRAGAAHYVPKTHFAERGAETILNVLSMAVEKWKSRQLKDYWRRTCYEYRLDNDSDLISPLVSRLQGSLTESRALDESSIIRIGVALHEAIRNAIHHGNLELDSDLRDDESDAYYDLAQRRAKMSPYQDRRVFVEVAESPEEVRYTIRDEGPGFNVRNFDYDPTDPTNLTRPSGRGLFLIRTFMDEVRFNEIGNEITMIRRHSGQENAGQNPHEENTPR